MATATYGLTNIYRQVITMMTTTTAATTAANKDFNFDVIETHYLSGNENTKNYYLQWDYNVVPNHKLMCLYIRRYTCGYNTITDATMGGDEQQNAFRSFCVRSYISELPEGNIGLPS